MHSEETPVEVCDRKMAEKGEDESEDRLYFTRWLSPTWRPN